MPCTFGPTNFALSALEALSCNANDVLDEGYPNHDITVNNENIFHNDEYFNSNENFIDYKNITDDANIIYNEKGMNVLKKVAPYWSDIYSSIDT